MVLCCYISISYLRSVAFLKTIEIIIQVRKNKSSVYMYQFYLIQHSLIWHDTENNKKAATSLVCTMARLDQYSDVVVPGKRFYCNDKMVEKMAETIPMCWKWV